MLRQILFCDDGCDLYKSLSQSFALHLLLIFYFLDLCDNCKGRDWNSPYELVVENNCTMTLFPFLFYLSSYTIGLRGTPIPLNGQPTEHIWFIVKTSNLLAHFINIKNLRSFIIMLLPLSCLPHALLRRALLPILKTKSTWHELEVKNQFLGIQNLVASPKVYFQCMITPSVVCYKSIVEILDFCKTVPP